MGRLDLFLGVYRRGYYFFCDCFEAHAGEEDYEDCDDHNRDESPRGRVVLGLAVVPHQLGCGEEVQHSDPL